MPEYIKRNKMLFLLLVMVAVMGLASASILAIQPPPPSEEVWVFPDDTHPDYDSDNPDHYLNIQAGVNEVAENGTVNVTGTYDYTNPGVLVVVVEKEGVKLLGDEGATLVGPGEGVESECFLILASEVTVEGFTITGFQHAITAGVLVGDDPPNGPLNGETLGVINGDPFHYMVAGTQISKNIINGNYVGIQVVGWGNYVENNIITSNHLGLSLLTAAPEGGGVDNPDNIVRNNQVTGNGGSPNTDLPGIRAATENGGPPAAAIAANPGAKIHKNNISGNTLGLLGADFSKEGLVFSSDSDVDATDNWWGDISGPYHETENPDGVGDSISDGVLFDPWLGHGNFELPSEATLVSPFNGKARAIFTSDLDGVTITIATEGADGWVAIMLADPDEEDKGFPSGVDESAGCTLFFIESSTSLAGLPVIFEIFYGPNDEEEELPDIKLYRYEDGEWVLLGGEYVVDDGNLYFRAEFTGFSLFGLFSDGDAALPPTGNTLPYLAALGLAMLAAGLLTYRRSLQGCRQ